MFALPCWLFLQSYHCNPLPYGESNEFQMGLVCRHSTGVCAQTTLVADLVGGTPLRNSLL